MDTLKIILYDTSPCLFTAVNFKAGRYVQVSEYDFFDLRTGLLSTFNRFL